mmetsp:Transcript_35432/g.100332  ORF Transcript_35432/g.100332 Transcript_35432/m.100332 type:complete len:260 (-) Transcript_35432:158-937(-)
MQKMRPSKSSSFRGVTLFRPTGKWRAQISASGKTTSLGDHNSEEQAARSFDRAVINKDGWQARTNFPVEEYSEEVEYLKSLSQQQLVELLRSRARTTGSRTSTFRGVSLVKQTGKWHAQIRWSRKPVHLGYFSTEIEAAKAYDRAMIFKHLQEGSKLAPQTNFETSQYDHEMDHLATVSEEELLAELHTDGLSMSEGFIKPMPGSYPPSPITPDVSSEGRTGTDAAVRFSTAMSGAGRSKGITKVVRLKNRRCRQKPVR